MVRIASDVSASKEDGSAQSIALVGASMGGIIALRVAAKLCPSAVVLVNSAVQSMRLESLPKGYVFSDPEAFIH